MGKQTKIPIWRNKKTIPILLQIVFAVVIAALGTYFVLNALQGLKKIGISLSFDFLKSTASFMISDKLIEFSPADSYGKALLVGLMNTLKIAVIGIFFSAIIGTVVGIGRLSDNWLVKKLAGGYVEIVRNIPLLVQIFFLYFTVFLPFPKIEQSINLFGIFYFSNRGNAIPWFTANDSWLIWLAFVVVGILAGVIMIKFMLKKQIEAGKRKFPFIWGLGSAAIILLLAFAITSELPLSLSLPVIQGRLYEGGYVITSEFAAILFGLIIYHSAFVAEIVRSGIMAVPKGQIEAAKALGLKKSTIMRLVTLPQAGRIIVPPLTSQFLNLVKNSTLGVAVGYTEMFSIGNTIINQTGRAVEIIVLVAGVYLIVSLIISFLMNWFNRHFQLVER
ncbi:amino acid ABC transporter permease [Paenibacillus eucommiae]|uniref:General L-amino acid transport system permease protein n=1 Tax=Paenibacillus eucommiae TaxID=1355755 RepID=A0ABS4J724_9BACL|nr:ABC transporter permease subunit [Paenibacillus eucommiae]MBP1995633.1 general L-amino acid transport system permease protein [Paenibacillus eucommiae]